jgi:2'-hydroxyisoflavone reductase
MTTRRDVLGWGAAILGGLGASRLALAAEGRADKARDILILGGTGFLGPQQVEYALARGHRVTIFNRGKSAPGLFGDRVEILLGNRDTKIEPGLAALAGTRRWDVVIDNSGYVPRHVRDSVALLEGRVGRYVYVSTIAVYDLASGGRFDEQSPLVPAPSPDTETVDGKTYGPLKAECDRIVRAAFGNRATVVRPTYIVGPGDDTDRFTYWVERVSSGGEVLGPPDPKREFQWIDVRDLCPWVVDLAEQDRPGVFNAAGPATPMNWEQVLQELARNAAQPVTVRWPTPAMLEAAKIRLPFGSTLRPSFHVASEAAQAAGLRFRSLADSAAATLAWWNSLPPERRANAEGWPTREQEQQVLRLLAGSASG